MNIHQTFAAEGLTPRDIGTCEVHMGQHKKQKNCKLWISSAPLKAPVR